jgi:hypothetical protein
MTKGGRKCDECIQEKRLVGFDDHWVPVYQLAAKYKDAEGEGWAQCSIERPVDIDLWSQASVLPSTTA